MAQFDTANGLTPQVALNAASISSSTTTAGNIIDTQGYGSLTFIQQVAAGRTEPIPCPSFTVTTRPWPDARR
jgi:hypothetical protein